MRFCGACGAPLEDGHSEATGERGEVGAQRRHMTVMFCDLVESTSLAERLDPEDFRDALSGYHAACARAIERFSGYVAQYQGDGVVAYFGYPRAHEDDAQRAVHASLDILDEVATLNERLHSLLAIALEVRVGIHTGLVIAGEMGTGPSRERYAAVGETLHIAQRVQTLAEPGTVVLTDPTLELIADHFEIQPLGEKLLKGISRPLRIYSAVSATRATSLGPLGGPGRAPMVDRSKELERLREAWQRACRGPGVTVHLVGEAGIGKSRLVTELREHVREQGGLERILQCSPHHSSTALYPAIRFLEQLSDLDRSKPPEQQLQALERCVRAAGLDPAEAVPLLADLLSVPGAAETPHEMTPRDARNAVLQILEDLLLGDAAGRPLLIVVEDLHWADPTTVDLLERIVPDLARMPVACVVTFRGEFQPPWTQWRPVSEIDLGPLATDDVRTMATAASPTSLDSDALQRVESAAEGVPLFVEEMVKALAAEAAGSGSRSPESRVPPTLQSLLAERLDRLPELASVIDVAAVLGREFERGLAEALTPLDRPGFRSAIAQLTAEDVLRPVEGSRTRLEFKHVLLQEAAHDRLVRRHRRALHARVAELLVAHGPSAWASEPERIAHHFSNAEQPEKALAYWEVAGRRALERAAFLEAAEHFRRALEALETAAPRPGGELERGELLTHRAAALQAGRSPAAGVELIYSEARAAFAGTTQRERLIPVLRGQYLFHVARAQYADALELADEMLAMGRHDERTAWVAEGHFYAGFTRMLTGDLAHARSDLEDAARDYRPPVGRDEIYESQSDPGVGALANLASVLWNQGHAREAQETSDRSLELAELVGGPVTLAQAWGMRCGLLLVRGRRNEFGEWLEKARSHSVERNIGYWSTVCSMWSAWARGLAGEPEMATMLQKYLDAYLEAGGRVGLPHFLALLAQVQGAAGERERALEALAMAQGHIDTAGERYYEPELQWLLARVLMAGQAPDPSAAVAAYERAMDSAHQQGANLLELRAATGLVLLQRSLGETPTALAQVESLCGWFGTQSDLADVVRARALLNGDGPR